MDSFNLYYGDGESVEENFHQHVFHFQILHTLAKYSRSQLIRLFMF